MNAELKGLVISGGKGTRLRPLTYTGAKQLVPIANKPIIFYAIEELVAARIRDITVVVSVETGDQIRSAVGDGAAFEATISYVTQPEPRGIAHAISCARREMGSSRFVTFLGDNFITEGITRHVRAFLDDDAEAAVLLKHVPDAREFGVAEFDGERLARVVEKPEHPATDLAVIGIYMFGPRVFEAIDHIQPSARGELEITDTIQWLIDQGAPVRADVVSGEWIDTGKHDDLLTANRLILERISHDVSGGAIDNDSTLHGRVVLEPGARVIRSRISGPAVIGRDTRIEGSYIGPFSSIGDRCRVVDSEIAGSVVMEDTTIEGIGQRIEHSLIGRNVDLRAGAMKPRGFEMVLGDFSKLRVP
jgi:glucose-1-phosphate thymidylyltransferase